jgi:RHS repeat-associated protein
VTYANGFSARYVYDDLDRVRGIYQTENNTESFVYSFIYNGEGDLYELRNYRTHRASFFEYDHAGRCMASKERAFTVTNGRITYGTNLSSYGYQYDECNNLSKLTCSVLGSKWSTVYTYDSDNRPSTTTLSTGKVISNTYDALGRLQKRTIGLNSDYETRFEYYLNGDNRTTLLHKYYNGSDSPFVYSYDDNGNITSITQGTTSISYVYDTANRLTRENNQVTNQTVTYEYDVWGNILNKKIYAYTTATNPGTPTGMINYAYGNTAWGDQLTSYAGQTISYDSMGNPTTYRGYTMTWRGKQLTSASNGTVSATFEYNEDGLRQKKTVNNISTDYYYNGSVLIGMQRGSTKYLFSYDASGNVVSVKYNGTEYYYLRNAQGDIVKLIDASGVSVVEYTYDTWGKAVTTTGTLAGTLGLFQPFRYRGYVYDWETGFYYLQSRYYDPTTGRFISADVLLSTGQGVLGHNCYAYCNDNPVSKVDHTGTSLKDLWDWLFGGGSCAGRGGTKSSEKEQFVYDPSSWNDKAYTEFRLEADNIIRAYAGEDACDAVWSKAGPLDAGIHINYGGPYSEKVFKKYIEEWGIYKTASNMAQYGVWKYNILYKEELKNYPKNWDEEKLAKSILKTLLLWRDGEYANDDYFFVSYTD